jgi:hypothetical protein
MSGTLEPLEQIGDVIQVEARPEGAQIARADSERASRPRRVSGQETAANRFVHDLAKRLTGARASARNLAATSSSSVRVVRIN